MLVIVRVNGHLKFLGLFIQMNIQIDTHTQIQHIFPILGNLHVVLLLRMATEVICFQLIIGDELCRIAAIVYGKRMYSVGLGCAFASSESLWCAHLEK